MEGDERETFYTTLPQLTNRILGLDSTGTRSAGWLSEQASLLIEPRKNVREAMLLQDRLLELLAAPSGTGMAPGLSTRRQHSGLGVLGIGGVLPFGSPFDRSNPRCCAVRS